jgi:hypothetical protein
VRRPWGRGSDSTGDGQGSVVPGHAAGRVIGVADAGRGDGNQGAGTGTAESGSRLMHEPESLLGIAFRYARWLRETDQWEAMDLFTWVIHPAIGRLAGMGKTRISDLTPAIVNRTILVAIQDRIDPELALGAWSDFLDFLDVEGVPHPPRLLDQAS